MRRHPGLVAKVLSLSGLVLIAWSYWGNRVVFRFMEQDVYLTDLVPLVLIVPFGIWRIITERDHYQRVRINVIIGLYLLVWVAMPLIFGATVPRLGGAPEPFPAIHVVGSVLFFAYGAAMLLFGKRLDCGWNCPCVTTRETVGYAFRDATPRRGWFWWHLRWLKWVPGALLILYLILLLVRPHVAYQVAGRHLYGFMTNTYFYSYLAVPLLGNRSYCRWLCPFAAFWGWLSYLGFYRIKAVKEECTQCLACERVCDMGIPIADFVQRNGQVRTVECMGCGRCVKACPKGILKIESAAKFLIRPPERAAARTSAEPSQKAAVHKMASR